MDRPFGKLDHEVCRLLRWKSMFIEAESDPTVPPSTDQNYWCVETQVCIGPDGLSVVAVAKASATLGDPFDNPFPARAVLIVDQNATEDQKCALVEFAQSVGGRLLENIVGVQSAPISMKIGEADQHGSVVLTAGRLARIQTRALSDKDHICGNEVAYYPPLTELTHAMPAYTVADEFQGSGLDREWRIFGKRSAFVGTFSR